MNKFLEKFLIGQILKSKKVWYTISAILVPIIARALDVEETHVSEIFWALVALTGAQGVADMGKHAK